MPLSVIKPFGSIRKRKAPFVTSNIQKLPSLLMIEKSESLFVYVRFILGYA